ncbi:MAG: AmmeMemoRadiSam system radical SAM enzyme [Candidatus Helarchaeota archaeon]
MNKISDNLNNKFIKKALLYKHLNGKIQCNTCEHKCELKINQIGFCRTRKNINNELFTLIYGNISSISNNPIEKKPFFHFHPGTFALTIGSYSCNFTCSWCQNYSISKTLPKFIDKNYLSPEQLVQLAIKNHSNGLSYSFNEPTLLLEHAINSFKIAKKKGLYNTFVSNGYMTIDALKILIDSGLDAINIDIKGNWEIVKKHCNADLNYIIRNAKYAKDHGVHVEITTLVITKLNDNIKILKEIGLTIKNKLGKNVPWHLTRYFPHYKYNEPPTSIKILEDGMKMAKNLGLNYVYIGNVPGHNGENTYCPNCKKLIIKRSIFNLVENKIIENRCPYCKEPIPIII